MPYSISKTFRFEAAHWLEGLPVGHKCSREHGHSYMVTLTLAAEELDAVGMVADFGDLAPFGSYIAGTLDHRCLNKVLSSDGELLLPQPTCELLAEHLFTAAGSVLPVEVASLVTQVTVAETATSSASYSRGAQ